MDELVDMVDQSLIARQKTSRSSLTVRGSELQKKEKGFMQQLQQKAEVEAPYLREKIMNTYFGMHNLKKSESNSLFNID